jgi:4-amino-4-deoxy-L-arabinose transferase-like glycosyltransferase
MKQWRYLGGVIFLAFILRIVALDKLPAGFTPDEASFGYDAYSILKTGKDQWGHPFPLVLESFGDFKAPLYSYVLIPFVKLLGLSETTVRLPNALLGTAAVYVTYLLARELKKFSKKKFEIGNLKLEILAAVLLAISPWHIMMSRGGFEANLTTFLLPLGIYLFLRGLKDPGKFVWSSVVFGLNLFSYHSAKLVTPLIIGALIYFYSKRLAGIKKKKYLHQALIVLSVFLALTVYTFTKGAARRAQDISIASGALEEQAMDRLEAINSGISPFVARLLHNKYWVISRRFVNNYRQYFSFKFLFSSGPAEATYGMIPGRGMLYWFELPLLLGFIIFVLRGGFRKHGFVRLMLVWIIVAPVPAALTMGVGYAGNRTVIILPAIQIALAIGGVWLYREVRKLSSEKTLNIAKWAFVSIIAFCLLSFIKDYFMLSPRKTSQAMLYGRKEAIQFIGSIEESYENIIISRSLSEPHIYVAFYNVWDPSDYQVQAQDWQRYKTEGRLFVDQLGEYRLGKYIFGSIVQPY